jgi:putative membrane protein
MNRFRESFLIYLKGVGMGGADVVPGVSGGTIALITGIYQTLLEAIGAIDLEALKLLLAFKFKEFWTRINGAFLLPLVLGIGTSLVTLAKLINFLMAEYPIPLWSFFFGLILVSAFWVMKEIRLWHWGILVSAIVGTAVAWWITLATPAETSEAWWFLMLSGAIAICAMILPGISGAFILLVLGKYEFILEALNNRDLATIAIFGVGCIIGLLSFSRAIAWLLRHYHDITIGLLAGFMLGSLNKVWPWKLPVSFRINSHGEQVPFITVNTSPSSYQDLVGQDPQLLVAILCFAGGILLVVGLERFAYYQAGNIKP